MNKYYYIWFFGYCYQSVNIIRSFTSQSDHIKQHPLYLGAHLFFGGEIRALWKAPMYEMLPEIENEDNYQAPFPPFLWTSSFFTSLCP